MRTRQPTPFTSALSRREGICVLAWLPVHIVLLPMLLTWLGAPRGMSQSLLNLIVYGAGAVYMVLAAFRFLRRDFDALLDRPLFALSEIVWAYAAMMGFNLLLAVLMTALLPDSENPNNAAVMSLVLADRGVMKATVMLLAPIVEEMLFRAGLFGLLRRRSRLLAYAVSMLAFAVYHVWAFAAADPIFLIYLLQYLPVGWLLARCYERTNSIWCSILFHMTVNTIAVSAFLALQEYL